MQILNPCQAFSGLPEKQGGIHLATQKGMQAWEHLSAILYFSPSSQITLKPHPTGRESPS